MRVARSRELVAQGRPAALVARVAGISRQAIYRRPARPPKGQRRPLTRTDEAILGVARENPTDGTRMVAALAARDLGAPVNRKRVQRLMREHRLLQRHRPLGRRRRPGFFRVERPDQLWHEHEIVHRRGGYRDPESQAFIESWFSKLKERCVWREEFETLEQARAAIGAYIERYHHRPHSGLAYRTPREVAATWKDHDDQPNPRGPTVNAHGVQARPGRAGFDQVAVADHDHSCLPGSSDC